MKKRLTITFVLSLCLVIAGQSVFAQQVDTADTQMVLPSVSPTVSITPTPAYVMVYPGLLPDSPLYTLKAMRDRLISLLIGDALKKAEFDLLQSDKRVGSTVLLLHTKKKEKQLLAISTFSKGLNYFDESTQKVREAKEQGESIAAMKSHLQNAGAAYINMLEGEEKTLSKDIKAQLNAQLDRLSKLLSTVDQL